MTVFRNSCFDFFATQYGHIELGVNMRNYNPFAIADNFDERFENALGFKKDRIAKIISSGPIEKLCHAYKIIAGKQDEFVTPIELGILDYLGLIVPYVLLNSLNSYTDYLKEFPRLYALLAMPNILLAAPIFLLNVIFSYIIRPLVAASLTLAFAVPFIFLIQPITYAIKQYRLAQIGDLSKKELDSGFITSARPNIYHFHSFNYENEDKSISIEKLQSSNYRIILWKGDIESSVSYDYKDYTKEELDNSSLAQNIMLTM